MRRAWGTGIRLVTLAAVTAAVLLATPGPARAVTGRPNAPQNASITVGNGYASLRWSFPVWGDEYVEVRAYSVVATDTVTRQHLWTHVAADPEHDNYQASTQKLVNGRAYDISVFAWGDGGPGAPATFAGVVPSPAGTPAGAPHAAQVRWLWPEPDIGGVKALNVSWHPAEDNGSPIVGYSMIVMQDNRVVRWINKGPHDRSARADGVPTGKPTTVYLVPVNRHGFSTESQAMTLAADTAHASVTVRNDYEVAVHVHIGDDTSVAWDLAPGETAGPGTVETSYEHGDGASVWRLDNPECGNGDGWEYWTGGHEYLVVVSTHVITCENGMTPALFIHDLTTSDLKIL